MRKGFTLVEILVALILLELGMLALVATGGLVARDVAAARRAFRAQAAARNRVELLRTVSCPSPGSGVESLPGGLREHWRVVADGPRRVVADSVEYPLPRGRIGRAVYRAATICRA